MDIRFYHLWPELTFVIHFATGDILDVKVNDYSWDYLVKG